MNQSRWQFHFSLQMIFTPCFPSTSTLSTNSTCYDFILAKSSIRLFNTFCYVKIFQQIVIVYPSRIYYYADLSKSFQSINIYQDMRGVSRLFNTLSTKIVFKKVETKVQNKIGFVYLNSPSDLNALSDEMRSKISGAVRDYQTSTEVKVIVILSNVQKAFCAGANIKEFAGKTSKDFKENDIFKQIHDTLYEAKKPIISGVNGVALGGGCQLALLTDVILCSQQARFALPQLKLGLIPGIGGTQRLARIAGRVNAMRYVLTSEFINAKRAYELGIVTQVVPYPQLHAKVIEIAKEITNKPLSALLAAKQVIKQNENLSMRQGQQLERKVFYPLYDTAGVKEGVDAFVTKRKPNHYDL